MTTIHLRKPVLRFGAVSVTAATLAAETSAQPGSPPESPLSDAMDEALQSPLHRELAHVGPGGQRLLLPPAVPSLTSGSHAGLAASPALLFAGGQVATADDAPSHAEVFLWTALSAAAGHYFTLRVHDWCKSYPGVGQAGRYDYGTGFGWQPNRSACRVSPNFIMTVGILGTIPLTGGAANLAGMDLGRSVLGSALGTAGGVLAALFVPDGVSSKAGMGVLTLTHATVATLFAKR
ncbi:MAG: hypothetical protein OXQ94_18155 [Gemmatimonadota bacterium]|nr:hypothetical protein [Gemmatimonadota bacterium]MDE2873599.1 hypothetical protein [Gemmatimonadota bacterium]